MPRSLRDDGFVRRLVGAATAAPSIHNSQPWRFRVVADDVIQLRGEPDRMLWVADPHGRALNLSCGAALFNLRLAIRAADCRPLVWPHPDSRDDPVLIATVQLAEGRPPSVRERAMAEAIGIRHSSRAPFSDRPLPLPVSVDIEQAASAEFAALRLLDHRDAALVIDLAEAAERELATEFEHRVELSEWVAGRGSTDDGIPAGALGWQPDHRPAPVRDFAAAAPSVALPSGSYERLPQLAVLGTARDEPADWLRAGQALQNVLLTATRHGVSTSLLYQPMELNDMRPRDHWWPWPECPQMIIRLGFGPPGAITPRRPVADVLETAL